MPYSRPTNIHKLGLGWWSGGDMGVDRAGQGVLVGGD